MSVFKKSDVKSHLSPRNRKGIHLSRPASQPGTTGAAADESSAARSATAPEVENLAQQTSSTGLEIPSLESDPVLRPNPDLALSKSARP